MSNLLEKASIVTTPTAYDNGKILSVKPSIVLGNELITNGDFSNGSTGWTVSNGTITDKYNASMTAYQTGIRILPFSNTGTFKVTFDLVVTSGSCKFDAGGVNNAIFNTSGTKEIIVTNTTKFEFNAFNLGWVGTLDNVSVKELIDADFDFTRGSSATRVNAQGFVEDVGNNLPRIDYTDGVGHWLFEPQSTNIITYSEDYSNSFYVKDSGVSVGTTNNSSPSINANATKIDVTNNGRIYANIATNTYYTTVFIKSGTFSHFKFAGSNIDLIAETNSNGTIQSFGNGWFRIGKSYTGNRPFQIQAYPDGTYSSHTTSGNYFIWGAQAEVQSFATSYIPTNGSTVTRLQDAAFGSGSSDLINSTEGVLYAEISALANDNIKKGISLSDGTTSNRIILRYDNASNRIKCIVVSSGVIQANMNTAAYDILDNLKIAVKFKENDFALWVNGLEIATDTSGNTFPTDTLSELNLDSTTIEPFYGKVKCVAVFKEALTDAELTCLTTI